MSAGFHVQTPGRLLRQHIGPRCRPALTGPLRDLIQPHAFQLLAVEIRIAGHLQLSRRINKINTARIGPKLITDAQRPIAAVKFISAPHIAFGAAEIGKDIFVPPAGRPQRVPIVIVPRRTPQVEHRIDCGGSAQSLAARLISGAAIEALLRDCIKPPVRVLRQERQHARRNDAPAVVRTACLNDADAKFAVFAQPACGCTATGSAANDDDVEVFHACSSCHLSLIVSLVSRLPSCVQPG